MKLKLFVAFAAFSMSVALPSFAMADVALTDLGSDQWRVQLEPLTFTIGSSESAANRMVIEDFFVADNTGSGVHVSGGVFWSLNGAAPIFISSLTNSGVWGGSSGQFDPNDLLFNYAGDYVAAGAGAVSPGDTVTLSADFIFSNPNVSAINSGQVFTAHLLNGLTSIATASVTSVPEPSCALILLMASALVLRNRSRV